MNEHFLKLGHNGVFREHGPYHSIEDARREARIYVTLHPMLREGVFYGVLSIPEALAHNEDYLRGDEQERRHREILRSKR